MEGWEVEELVADHYNRLWEEMNDVPEEETPEEEPEACKLYSVADLLRDGLDDLEEAIQDAQNAADDAEGWPVANRIGAILMDLRKCESWMRQLEESVRKELIRMEESA